MDVINYFLLTFTSRHNADMISQRSSAKTSVSESNVGTGKSTLRLRSQGPATVEDMVRAIFKTLLKL